MSAVAERVLVVIPTYDERENLPVAVAGVRAAVPDADILVVDDDSPDGTGRLADELAAADRHVHVLHRAAKQGLGAAYKAAFGWAASRGYDAVVEMDADGSHDPTQLPRLLAELGTADLVLGSRWVDGGAVLDWPTWRRVLSRGGNTYARLLLRLPVRDATGGYRVFRTEVLRALPLAEVSSAGYCFQVDLVWRTWQAGYRIREVPITFRERTVGQSKMSGSIVAEALLNVTRWGAGDALGRLWGRRPVARPAPDRTGPVAQPKGS
ncbi:MAG: polyprenol monophosphomannose synthase [Geodermatophilaceae bacterium]